MSGTVLERIIVTFHREGVELEVRYAHADEPPTPGTKKRTATAVRMARKGLEMALEGLGWGSVAWGGFSTDTRQSTDRVLVDRERAA